MESETLSIKFDKQAQFDDWVIINDDVMGGLSSGQVEIKPQSLLFSGNVSTENNGGFTSAYAKITDLNKQVNSVNIMVIGDGNQYQLRLRTQVDSRDIVYKKSFSTTKQSSSEDKPTVYRFNLDDFKASFRGRLIDNAPAIKSDAISHIGFMIIGKEATVFSLEVYQVTFK